MQPQRTIGRPKGSKNGVRTLVEVACIGCGSAIFVKPSRVASKRFCSRTCQYPPKPSLLCEWCGKRFAVPASRAGSARFCGYSCMGHAAGNRTKDASQRPPEFALRFLYEEEQLPTRAIGAFYGVAHITVRRWLRFYNITCRPPHHGLETTGYATPSEADLRRMICEQSMPFAEIGSLYGVGGTAVSEWARKLNIPHHPAGYRGRRYICADGHEVRSSYEQRVDDWLCACGVAHEYEPRVAFDARYRSDFLANGHYIEIWGMPSSDTGYTARRVRKTRLYHEHGLSLIELTARDFRADSRGLWKHKLTPVLTPVHCESPPQSKQRSEAHQLRLPLP